MSLRKLLKNGDEVRCEGEAYSFISKVTDVIGDNIFAINLRPEGLDIKPGDRLTASCIAAGGLYVFEVSVIEPGATMDQNAIYMTVKGGYKKIQRRDTYRVSETIPIEIRKVSNDTENAWIKTNTVNISESGMLIAYNESCAAGQAVELNIYINLYGIDKTFKNIAATVVRCNQLGKKEHAYTLGIRYTDLPESLRNEVIRLVVRSQCNALSHK